MIHIQAGRIFCACIVLLFSVPLCNADEGKTQIQLTVQGVHKIMDTIFQEHVSQKTMTAEVMHRAVQLFCNQFDSHRCYLLAEEAHPVMNLSKAKLYMLVQEYENNNFRFFSELIKLFQKAIRRARSLREKLEYKSFQDVANKLSALKENPHDSSFDFSLEAPFAKTSEELQLRIRAEVTELLKAKENQGIAFDAAKEDVEDTLRNFENSYLYESKDGKQISASQQEDLFTFHILDAFTASLDAHSAFLSPLEAQNLKMNLQKDFIGIGVEIQEQGKSFIISKMIDNSPARKSGKIKVGDEIIAVNGQKVANWNLDELMQQLQGVVGSDVRLELRSDSGVSIQVVLPRAKVVISQGRVDSSYEKVPGGIIAEIALHSFYEAAEGISSVEDLQNVLESLSKKGKIKGLLLDLRDNLGGYLMQAVKVAGLFIKSGVIAVSKTQDGHLHYFRDLDPLVSYSGPMVILASKQTASAAEIVTEALKDYGIAIIVGDERTYGKGSIQMQTATENETIPSFKVTIGRYYTVSGHSIQLEGVTADVLVPGIYYHRKVGEQYLENPLSQDSIQPSFNDTLPDLDETIRATYQSYYLPYLQEPITKYRKWIPQLKMKSAERLAKNEEYQHFLQGLPLTEIKRVDGNKAVETLTGKEVDKVILEMQRQEAINVLKDLMQLSQNN